MPDILILTPKQIESSLESSFYRAFRSLGRDVEVYEYSAAPVVRRGLKKIADQFLLKLRHHFESPGEILKLNIQLTKVVLAKDFKLIVCFTNSPINPSTIAYLRSLGKQVVLVYPDAIINMGVRNSSNVALFDAIFSYSEVGVEAFKLLGAKAVHWCPLAGDAEIHGGTRASADDAFTYDIAFIGNARPEREATLDFVIQQFPDQRIKILGDWRDAQSERVRSKAENRQVYGAGYAEFIRSARINLNIIDHSNFPAANMRFFEVPTAGGLQISSSCPEMAPMFQHGKHLLYYQNHAELQQQIRFALDNPQAAEAIRSAGHALVHQQHLYKHRAQYVLDSLPARADDGARGLASPGA
jgi:hypothetical protein